MYSRFGMLWKEILTALLPVNAWNARSHLDFTCCGRLKYACFHLPEYNCSSLHMLSLFNGPCILRPHVQPEENDLKLESYLYWKHKSGIMSRMKEIYKWKPVLNPVDHCMHNILANTCTAVGGACPIVRVFACHKLLKNCYKSYKNNLSWTSTHYANAKSKKELIYNVIQIVPYTMYMH